MPRNKFFWYTYYNSRARLKADTIFVYAFDGITRALKSAQFICESTKGKYLPRHSNSPACVDGVDISMSQDVMRALPRVRITCEINCSRAPFIYAHPPQGCIYATEEKRSTVHPTKTLSWRSSTLHGRPFISLDYSNEPKGKEMLRKGNS